MFVQNAAVGEGCKESVSPGVIFLSRSEKYTHNYVDEDVDRVVLYSKRNARTAKLSKKKTPTNVILLYMYIYRKVAVYRGVQKTSIACTAAYVRLLLLLSTSAAGLWNRECTSRRFTAAPATTIHVDEKISDAEWILTEIIVRGNPAVFIVQMSVRLPK